MYALETKLNEIYLLGVEKWCSYGTSRSPCPCKQGGGRRQDNLSHFQMFQTVSKFIIGIKDIISGLLRKHLAHDQLPSSSLHMNFTAVVGQFKEIFILDFLTCTIMSR